jgi:hypothetical protein
MSDDAPLPVTATVTTAPAPLPEGFSVPAAVAFARDLAIGMYDEAVLLKKHGVSAPQYQTLQGIPYFQELVRQMAIEWNAPKSVQQRLAVETAVGLEEVLPDVIARAKVKNEPLQGVAQLVKVLADIAGANQNARQPAAPAEKFKITINLGADVETYNKTKPVITLEAAGPSESAEVQPVAQGFGALLSLQTEPETP